MFTMFCRLLIFFQNKGFRKKTSFGNITRVSNILIHVRSDKLSGLIWIKSVPKLIFIQGLSWLSADDTSTVRAYEDNPNKLGSRLDRANLGFTLNL